MTETPLRFAAISDVHLQFRPSEYGCAPSTTSPPEFRLARFLAAAAEWDADVVIQLGDMHAESYDDGVGRIAAELWQSFPTETIGVNGNHDSEPVPLDSYLAAMEMPAARYRRTVGDVSFLVLDAGNPAVPPGAPTDAGDIHHPDQLEWLAGELRRTAGRCVILVHNGVVNGTDRLPPVRLRDVFERANRNAGYRKVIGCLWGHHHRSHVTVSDGIWYVALNSASYRWCSEQGPMFYRDPAPFAFGTISPGEGRIAIGGTGTPNNWADGGFDPPEDPDTFQRGTLTPPTQRRFAWWDPTDGC